MSLAACIRRWPIHDTLAGLTVTGLRQVVLEDRGRRLLDLQEKRILVVTPLQQYDERACADAADADDLARDVDQLKVLEQVPAVGLQRRAVLAELLVDGMARARRRSSRSVA